MRLGPGHRSSEGKSVSLREGLLASGHSTEQPDRDADHHAPKDDLRDQEEDTCCDPHQREEQDQQDFPQQDRDHTRGGEAENGLQNGQAPLEAATLRRLVGKSVITGELAVVDEPCRFESRSFPGRRTAPRRR
jgi:hypothetical protein